MARPFKNLNAWTPEEDELLLARLKQGERARSIGRTFPNRSEASVKGRLQIIRKEMGVARTRGSVANARAYKQLGEAINALIARMPANDVLKVLGNPPVRVPGTEPSHKTCSMQRHVTAVQAQRIAA